MMRKAIATALLLLVLGTLLVPGTATAKDSSRKWKASYNSALSLHEASVPKVYKPGTKLLVEYRKKSIVVKAVAGGCTCFDLSDEAFNKLSDTSQGVITVSVTRR